MAPKLDRAPPVLGQHSREILSEFDFSAAEIEAMITTKLVVDAPAQAA